MGNGNTTRQREQLPAAAKSNAVPYPKNLFVVKDPGRSDVRCLNGYGSATMTVKKTPDNSTVAYVRKDMIDKNSAMGMQQELRQMKAEREELQRKIEEIRNSNDETLRSIAKRAISKTYLFGALLWLLALAFLLQEYIETVDIGHICFGLSVVLNAVVLHFLLKTARSLHGRKKKEEQGCPKPEKS